jgi:hypothetical protein
VSFTTRRDQPDFVARVDFHLGADKMPLLSPAVSARYRGQAKQARPIFACDACYLFASTRSTMAVADRGELTGSGQLGEALGVEVLRHVGPLFQLGEQRRAVLQARARGLGDDVVRVLPARCAPASAIMTASATISRR